MARLFPLRSETPSKDGVPRVVDLEGEDADAVFSALSSTTAREIYTRLDEEPGTPSDVADAIDSSIQNVRYHLENLEDAGLVEVVDTWYSSRGNEMSVYATTDSALIVTSDESTGSQLKEAISRLIGGIGALAGGSLLVQYGLTRWFGGPTTGADGAAQGGSEPEYFHSDDDAGDGGADAGNGESDADAESGDDVGSLEIEEDAADAGDVTPDGGDTLVGDEVPVDADPTAAPGDADGVLEGADAVFSTIPPGLLFFLGGLVVLLVVTAYWYWYRPNY
ncbi:ArsR/SmtB family transcription factor [Halopiger goleimassiliensis]|uniref:ArsR/SmtB family transcription factor n=1 Tax=Halopiger goleimassiliensis TaxID=1293048 RepID=UPI000677BDA8|nr:helix-turn-helix domain-containing protein [Halopiger goleimassiliensis]